MSGNVLNGMPLPGMGNVQVVNPMVEMLENVLNQAKAGHVVSVAMVIVDSNGGVATPWAGPQVAQMYLGAGMLQSRVIRALESPPKSAIIPARMGG